MVASWPEDRQVINSDVRLRGRNLVPIQHPGVRYYRCVADWNCANLPVVNEPGQMCAEHSA